MLSRYSLATGATFWLAKNSITQGANICKPFLYVPIYNLYTIAEGFGLENEQFNTVNRYWGTPGGGRDIFQYSIGAMENGGITESYTRLKTHKHHENSL